MAHAIGISKKLLVTLGGIDATANNNAIWYLMIVLRYTQSLLILINGI